MKVARGIGKERKGRESERGPRSAAPSRALFSLPGPALAIILAGTLLSVAGGVFFFGFLLFLQALGHPTSFQGLMYSMMELTVALTILPLGLLSPRIGRRRTMALGLLATSASYLLVSIGTGPWHFAPAMVLLGVGNAGTLPGISAALADSVRDWQRKYAMSLYAFASILGNAAGFLVTGGVAGLMGEETGFRAAFQLAFLASLIALPAIVIGIRDGGEATGAPGRAARRILPFVLPTAVLGLGAGLVVPFFPVYFKLRFGAGSEEIGLIFTITQLFWALAYLAVPVLADRTGSVRALLLLQSLAVVALLAIPASPSFGSAGVLFSVRMILMNASRPVADAYMMTLVGRDLRSTAAAANYLAWMLPHTASVGVGGALMALSLELPFLLCGALYIVSTSLYAYFFLSRDDARQGSGCERGAGRGR